MSEVEALESILTETLGQLEAATKALALNGKVELSFSSMLKIAKEKPLEITAIALAEGEWKGVWYPASELKKAAKQLIGLEGKVEHSHTIKYKGRTVGKALKYWWDEVLKAIKFKGVITDQEAIQDVLSGKLKAISMQTFLDRICEKCGKLLPKDVRHCPECGPDARILAKNLQFIEWSLVEEPACEGARIFVKSAERESVSREHLRMRKELISEQVKTSMSEIEKVEEIEIKEGQVLALPENFEELSEDEIELELLDEEEARKRRRTYYKYPPGRYPVRRRRRRRYPAVYYPPYYPYGYYYYYRPYGYIYYPYYYPYPYPYYPYYPYYGYPYGYPARRRKVKKSETEEAQRIILCPVCGEELESREEFERHWAQVHEREYGPFRPEKVKPAVEEKTDQEILDVDLAQLPAKPKKGDLAILEVKGRFVVFEATGDPRLKWRILGNFATREEAEEFIRKRKAEKSSEAESMSKEELRRKRCFFCDQLIEPEKFREHLESCEEYKKTVELAVRCKFCGEVFPTMKELKAHLKECEKYLQYRYPPPEKKATELAEEKTEPEKEPESPEPAPEPEQATPEPEPTAPEPAPSPEEITKELSIGELLVLAHSQKE